MEKFNFALGLGTLTFSFTTSSAPLASLTWLGMNYVQLIVLAVLVILVLFVTALWYIIPKYVLEDDKDKWWYRFRNQRSPFMCVAVLVGIALIFATLIYVICDIVLGWL